MSINRGMTKRKCDVCEQCFSALGSYVVCRKMDATRNNHIKPDSERQILVFSRVCIADFGSVDKSYMYLWHRSGGEAAWDARGLRRGREK